MKQTLRKTLALKALMLVTMLVGAINGAWADEVTYTFTSKSWTATLDGTDANWTSGKDGYGFSNSGIQVTTTATGANGTSPVEYSNITKIVVTYNTNKSKGTGTITAQVGNNKSNTNDVKYDTGDGTSAYYTTEFDYKTPESGKVKLTVETTVNSIYLVSVAITYTSVPASPLASIAVDATDATTVFHVGDDFTHDGAVVTATYENETTKDVTKSATFNTPDMTTAGTKTVTVSYKENEVEKTASYDIIVKAPAILESISLSGTYPTEFTQGKTFSSEGIIVTANYDDESTKDVTEEAEFSGYDMSAIGTQTVTVTYGGKTATYNITVNEYVQPSIITVNLNNKLIDGLSAGDRITEKTTVTIDNVNLTFGKEEVGNNSPQFDAGLVRMYKYTYLTVAAPSGYVIQKVEFTDTYSWADVTASEETLNTNNRTWEGEASSITFSFGAQCRPSQMVVTIAKTTPQVLASIALSGEYPTTFHVGDTFSAEGMTVTATYESGKTADVTEDATFSTPDMTTAGTQTVTVSYTENDVTMTATYDIEVKVPATLTSIALSGTYPTKFEQGGTFSTEGIVVTASYDDETSKEVTEGITFSGYDMSTLGDQTVTVTYEGKTATYTITVVEKMGTENNPYTVAEAIEATPASGTSENVYIHGIVCGFYGDDIVSDGSNYRYYISDDGTESNKMLVYRGKGLNNVDFSNADDLQVGDEVLILGGLTTYRNEAEVASGNYIVSLNRPVDTTPSITLASRTITATAAGLDGTIAVTYNNITEVEAEVFFCDANGEDATYDWIIAAINDENNVEYVIGENESTEARTAYLKVYAMDDETNLVYSELLTVTQAGFVVDYATLPFEFNGIRDDISETSGLTQEGLGSDYAATNASTRLKFDHTGDALVLKLADDANPYKLIFSIKGNSFSGGTFSVQTSNDGETYTTLKNYTELEGSVKKEVLSLSNEVRYIKWFYDEKSSGNVGLGDIRVIDAVDYTRSSATGNYGTICLPHDAVVNGAELYSISGKGSNWISLSKEDVLEAGVPYIFMATADAQEFIYTSNVKGSPSEEGVNGLIGSLTGTDVDENMYIIYNNEVCLCGTGCSIAANRAYIDLSKVTNAEVKPDNVEGAVKLFFNGAATAINSVNAAQLQGEAYDLTGRRVKAVKGGLYIVNGKKIVK